MNVSGRLQHTSSSLSLTILLIYSWCMSLSLWAFATHIFIFILESVSLFLMRFFLLGKCRCMSLAVRNTYLHPRLLGVTLKMGGNISWFTHQSLHAAPCIYLHILSQILFIGPHYGPEATPTKKKVLEDPKVVLIRP